MKTTTLLCALGLVGLTSMPCQAAPVETPGFLKYECWFPPLRDANLVGTDVTLLDLDLNYPNLPDLTSYTAGFNSRGVFPDDSHAEYGARMTGWITPTVTGDYDFYLASDDASQLWISTDGTEANLVLAADEIGCCKGFLEVSNPQTTASPVHLLAGQKYAVKILLKEGGGGDYVQVAMQATNGTTPAALLKPLVSTMMSSMADPAGASLAITQQPVATSTTENALAVSFSIAATAVTPYGKYTSSTPITNFFGEPMQLGTKAQLDTFYQWFTNGVEVPGANGTNYSIAWPKKAQDGLKVKCYVAVPGIPLYSSEVRLTVTADTTPPTVVKAAADSSFVNVAVKFSEPMPDSALLASHYGIDQGVTVSSVDRVDLMTVKLNTTRMTDGKLYTLTLNGVQDTATPANTIAANTQVQFKSWVFVPGIAIRHKYTGFDDAAGDNVNNLFSDPRYPNNPDRIDVVKRVEYPADGVDRDNTEIPDASNGSPYHFFFDALDCWFTPATTGNYVFLASAPDRMRLFLSTDESPANKYLIASENTWTLARNWVADYAGTPTPACRSDQYPGTQWPDGGNTITLQAGKRYYLLLIHHFPSWAGGAWLGATYKMDTDPDPANGTVPTLEKSAIGSYMDPTVGSVTLTLNPTSVSVDSGTKATFKATATGSSAYTTNVTYQWQSAPKGSSTWADISGATATNYTTGYLGGADDGKQFRVIAIAAPVSATSSVATLTVKVDLVPPTVVKASTDMTWSQVVVTFSEPVSDTALLATRYVMDKSIAVTAVSRVDSLTVKLTTSKLTENQVYTLTINGVQDTATPPNTLAANTHVDVRSLVFLTGAALHQKYSNVDMGVGSSPAGLFGDPRYPYNPDRRDIELRWEYPANGLARDQATEPNGIQNRLYFDTIEGYFIPPTTGNYVFLTTGADRFWLFLSTDEGPANMHMITAQPGGWTSPRQWMTGQGTPPTDITVQRSDTFAATEWLNGNTISLEAGKRYYMLSIHHDTSGAGDDDFAATYKLESEPDPINGDAPRLTGSVIGYYFDPSGASVSFTSQPVNASALQGGTATFTTVATGISAYGSTLFFQWQSAPKGSSTWTDIAGATAVSYTTPFLGLADEGTQFRVIASVPPYSKASSAATLTVLPDTVPPTLGSVRRSFTNDTTVLVIFSERMDPALANIAGNYTINNGITLNAAVLQPDGKTVVLTTSPIAKGTSNTLTVTGVKDLFLNPIAPNTKLAVGFERGALLVLNNTDPITVNASDGLILSRLQSRGYYVQAVGSTNDDASMAAGKDIAIVSVTINSGNVAGTYKNVAVPFITFEQGIQDDMAMTTVIGTTDRGTTPGQTDLEIVDPSHPLAAGLPAGQVTVTTSAIDFAWGQPNTNAHNVAKLVGTAGNFGIYGYDKGAALTDGTQAAERRVMFFLTDNAAAVLNGTGWKLFDAAVDWAQGISAAAPTRLSATVSGGNIVISWTPAGGRLQSTTALGGTWTDEGTADPATILTSGNSRFFRVVNP